MPTQRGLTSKQQELDEEQQIIYIDPTENVTMIRERLKQIVADHLVLVVPPQTQLKGNVAWKLLHKSIQEMGKTASIVSVDTQIRVIARSVKFKALASLPGSKPTRQLPEL